MTRLDLGGAQRLALQIAAHMAQRGWDSYVVAGRGGEPREFECRVAEELDARHQETPPVLQSEVPPADAHGLDRRRQEAAPTARGLDSRRQEAAPTTRAPDPAGIALGRVRLHFADSLVRPIVPLRDCAAVFELAGLFRRIRPHIVHTHTSKAGIVGRIAAWLAGVPVRLHTVHGWSFNDLQPAPRRLLFVALERYAACLSTRLITVCKSDIQRGLDAGIGRAGLYEAIRWGVRTVAGDAVGSRAGGDPTIWGGVFAPPSTEERRNARRQLGLHPDRPTAGWIGPLKPQKAPLDFIRVAAGLAVTRPDAQFFMAGDGILRAAVRQSIESLKLGDKIHLLGWQYDVPVLMHAMDVLVQTSHWEGLPLTLIEAAASGVPFVATDVGGNNELLEEGFSGAIVPREAHANLMAEVCRQLDLSSEERGRLATATRLKAETTCNLAGALEKTARLYRTALNQVD